MKYDKMVAYKKALSREKTLKARAAIGELLAEDEAVTVAELVKKTGLSREFFYKNSEVRSCLEQARKQQDGIVFERPRKAILDKAMSARLVLVEKQLEKERIEKEELRKQNEKLQKALKKKNLNVLRGL